MSCKGANFKALLDFGVVKQNAEFSGVVAQLEQTGTIDSDERVIAFTQDIFDKDAPETFQQIRIGIGALGTVTSKLGD